GDTAQLISYDYPAASRYCFEMFYHMFGASIGKLNVYVKPSSQKLSPSQLVWSETGNQGDLWRYMQVTATNPSDDFNIVVEGVVGSSWSGDIAIDDTRTNVGDCLPQGFCDFEQNYWCGWTNQLNLNLNWTRWQGKSSSSYTGPSTDHTTLSENGYYIYVDMDYVGEDPHMNDPAQVFSPMLTVTDENGLCLTFWYHMYGDHVNQLGVYVKQRDYTSGLLWSRQGSLGSSWNYGQVSIQRAGDFTVVFEALRGAGYKGDIALDDIKFIIGACPATQLCDFEENNICGFENDPTVEFVWILNQIGPSIDHTTQTGNGHYMLADASSVDKEGSRAKLITAKHAATTDKCVTFWYNMYGDDVGTLNVWKVENQIYDEHPHWSLHGNRGDIWKRASFPLQALTPFQLVFEAIRGKSELGDIAIDDIQLSDQLCPLVGTCDFEYDTCGWTNVFDDSFDWTLNSGTTNTDNTGPSGDHTSGSGKYMYIETSSPRVTDETARLIRVQCQKFAGAQCVSFWYHMHGSDTGILNMLLSTEEAKTNPLWSRHGPQGRWWVGATVNVKSDVNYKVAFESVVGSGQKSDIALDDIAMTSGQCPEVSWTTLRNPNTKHFVQQITF
uniref:MAM domain-containing protein n=1 Tax=Ciona intestinalis TaxID=7719 RepID=H2Y3P5_CIOIN